MASRLQPHSVTRQWSPRTQSWGWGTLSVGCRGGGRVRAGTGRGVCPEVQVQPPGGPTVLRSKMQTRCLPAPTSDLSLISVCLKRPLPGSLVGPAVSGQVGAWMGSPGLPVADRPC